VGPGSPTRHRSNPSDTQSHFPYDLDEQAAPGTLLRHPQTDFSGDCESAKILYLRLLASVLATFSLWGVLRAADGRGHKTQNVIFVMTDGLRWQEVFRGADASLINKENGVTDVPGLRSRYWRESAEERRAQVMPFVWSMFGKSGQIYGNRDKGSDAFVTNGLNFSYPGYSETLCGFADSRIRSNDKTSNPNMTVLEWLHRRPAYRGRVAAFAAWDAFPFILNAPRAGFVVNAGYDPFTLLPESPRVDLLNQIKAETPRIWEEEPFDAIPFHTALEYLLARHPRILYLSLGETDDWAHARNYTEYLNAAHRVDAYLNLLWRVVQSLPEYRDQTTLIISTDHGRGEGSAWKDHGEKIPESKYIWMAFLGPDTAAQGEHAGTPAVAQNQIAATLAAFLGEDYATSVPQSGRPIPDVLPR
jgi:hypothetical protein